MQLLSPHLPRIIYRNVETFDYLLFMGKCYFCRPFMPLTLTSSVDLIDSSPKPGFSASGDPRRHSATALPSHPCGETLTRDAAFCAETCGTHHRSGAARRTEKLKNNILDGREAAGTSDQQVQDVKNPEDRKKTARARPVFFTLHRGGAGEA